MISARVPASMFASCASATTLAASACSCFATRLGIVDPHQHGGGADVLAAHNRDIRDTSVDARRDVEPRRVHLALHQQGLAPQQYQNDRPAMAAATTADNDRRDMSGRRRPRLRRFRWLLRRGFRLRNGFRLRRGFCWNVACRRFHLTPPQTCIGAWNALPVVEFRIRRWNSSSSLGSTPGAIPKLGTRSAECMLGCRRPKVTAAPRGMQAAPR